MTCSFIKEGFIKSRDLPIHDDKGRARRFRLVLARSYDKTRWDKNFPGDSDYTKLTAWAKGNSISVDQSTISIGRRMMTLLVDRLKSSLIRSDGPIGLAIRHYDKTTGATLDDLEKQFSKVRMGKNTGAR